MDFGEGVEKLWLNGFRFLKNNRTFFALILYGKPSPLLNRAFQILNFREGDRFGLIHHFLERHTAFGLIADLPMQVQRAMISVPFDQEWEALPNLTMVGDAAHLMPPYAGEGVNLAMLDALELAESLSNPDFPDPLAAIDYYEKKMLARASETAAMTMENTAGLHGPDGIGFMLGMFQ